MRNSKIGECKECKDKKKIHAKEMCKMCYSREYRKTPSGKKSLEKYNKSDGKKASSDKYRLKHHKPRKPKVDSFCDCGKIVVAKGLCLKCYQKKRYNSLPKPVGHTKRNRVTKEQKIITEETFNKLIELVSMGMTIKNAIKTVGCVSFYKQATDLQKTEIKLHKNSTGSHRLY